MNRLRNNYNHIFVIAIILCATLIAGLAILQFISHDDAKATLFEINKSQFKRAPEFTGITGHLNTPTPVKLADLKGKVVLVHFGHTLALTVYTLFLI